MNISARLVTTATLGLALAPVLAGPALAAVATQPDRHVPAVFVETDNTSANAIIAYDRAADGTLTEAGTYLTGGVGGVLDGAVVDNTASQGSLTIDRANSLLYAVNAGSDTVTVFSIHGDRLVAEQEIPSGGDFPVSVTTYGNLVYVLNARSGGSVQGFLRRGNHLQAVPAWHRNLGLDTTQVPEFTHTPGQVLFTPDGTKLIVSTKASASLVVFRLDYYGGPSKDPVVTADPGAVPFGLAFDPRGHLVVAEAGVNAVATFAVNPNGSLGLIARAATGQQATCWVTASGARLYASNAGSANVSGYTASKTGALTSLGTAATDPGTVDAAATPDGRYLYVQAGANGTVDAFGINKDGTLAALGSVTVPGAVGGEGIVTT